MCPIYDIIFVILGMSNKGVYIMSNDFIRVATEHDLHLIESYFEQVHKYYEEQGELIAMQDIKYFIENMREFSFFVKKENNEEIVYIFEFPETMDGKRETGTVTIPLQNN